MSWFFTSGDQSIGASASAPFFPMHIQGWFPLELTHLISLLSKRLESLLQHHSSKALVLQNSAIFMVQLSYPYKTTGKPQCVTDPVSVPIAWLYLLCVLFIERKVGKALAKRLDEDFRSCRNCQYIYSFLASIAAITWPLSWLIQLL